MTELPLDEPMSAKIDTLNNALSRAQSRIDELDAKLLALSDKEEATRILLTDTKTHKFSKTKDPLKKTTSQKLAHTIDQGTETDDAVTFFTRGMDFFKLAKYSDAELVFDRFTEIYPEHILAGSAQFYAGESYFRMGEYQLALHEYQKVISSFRTSPRVSSALVRISHCYSALGNTPKSSHAMSKAHELFEGNPSLDWMFSGIKKEYPKNKQSIHPPDLSITPIEPNEEPKN